MSDKNNRDKSKEKEQTNKKSTTNKSDIESENKSNGRKNERSNGKEDKSEGGENDPTGENENGIVIDKNQPSWVYDNLSWYLSWTWGNLRAGAQPFISNKYTADCVYSDPESGFEIHLGGLPSLFNEEKLSENGITHILTAVLGIGNKYSKDKFTTLNIPVRDVEWERLNEYFDTAVDFISECERAKGKVFVHCMCGVSRSATLVAAFLIKAKGLTASDAISLIHSKRRKIDPNPGFRKQLELYEKNII